MANAQFSIPLDLSNVEVIRVEVNERGYVISVEITLEGTRCGRCGRRISVFHGYNEWVELRHLPILDRAVSIRYRPKGYECPYCEGQPTTTQQPRWHKPGSTMTKAYERYLLKALIHSTITDVSQKEGLSYDKVLGVMERCVADEVDWSGFKHLRVVGIDEIARKKGQGDYAVIVTSRDAQGELRILGVLPDRQASTIETFLASIPEHLKRTIDSVCVDMYQPYHQAIQSALPAADIVVDRFHVVKHYTDAADTVRKKTMKDLKKRLSKAEYQALKGVHLAFHRHRANLSETDRALLDRLFGYNPMLGLVYAFREGLFAIFEKHQGVAQATQDLKAWMFLVREQHIPGFDAFLTTLQTHLTEIANFFKHRLTSGFVEGLNTKIRVLTRRCFGLFNLQHFFQRLWLDVEGYRALAYTH